MPVIEIIPGLVIPDEELRFTASRSGGPGGQNVNKVNSRVTLLFDVDGSRVLTVDQKARLRERLAGRISSAGLLRVVSQRHRTQAANRRAAQQRFEDVLRQALTDDPPRVATRPSPAARQRRLLHKVRRARLKNARGRVGDWDD